MIPGGGESVDELTSAVADGLGDGPRLALGCAEWRPGDTGFDVIARARLALQPAVPSVH
jgi:hypothetical protein